MRHKRDVVHDKQIPTNLRTIKSELFRIGVQAIYTLFDSLISEPDSFCQKNNIIITAFLFEKLSCLVYYGKNGRYTKPPVEKYYREIFEAFAETPEEVYERTAHRGVTREQADHVFKLVWQVADLVCPMMACVCEQAIMSQYAYAIEYVIRHDGDLPRPEIPGYSLFPHNYPDYRYGEGIAETISQYDGFHG